MTEAASPLRETVLRECQAVAPNAWYPKSFAGSLEELYSPLNDLRLGGFIQLTEWEQGQGQGYIITPLGTEILENPVFLAQLRAAGSTIPLDRIPPTPAPSQPASTTFERGEEIRDAWYYGWNSRVTYTLLAINVVVFLVSWMIALRSRGVPFMSFLASGDMETLHKMGSLGAADLVQGEWWRLLTNCFLHYGLMHLSLNMLSLFLARKAEALWGSKRFLVLYLVCGICGSCVAIYSHPGEPGRGAVYLAGASGALWGVMASIAAWLILNRTHLPPGEVRFWLQQLAFTLLLNTGVSMLPRISASAHFAGAGAGFVVAILLQIQRYGPPSKRFLAALQIALLPAICVLGLITAFGHDHRLMRFSEIEDLKKNLERDRPQAEEFRKETDAKIRPLVKDLDMLDERSTSLYLKAAAKRDQAKVDEVKADLEKFVKNATEVKAWFEAQTPVDFSLPLRELSVKQLDAMMALAKVRSTQFSEEIGKESNKIRTAWLQVLREWERELSKRIP